MERRGPVLAQGLQMIRCGVTFVASQAVLGINGVPFFHAGIAMGLREDRCSGDGNAARVALDERFLLDQDIQLHRVDEQIIRLDSELLQRGSHGLAAGLIDVPRVDALGIDFRDGPGNGMFANARGKFHAALCGKFFRIVEADNAPLGIENHRGGDDRAEERAAAGFIEPGNAHPAKLSRRSLETGRAEAAHCAEILAWRSELVRLLVSQRDHGVNFCRAPRRNVGGEESNHAKENRDADKGCWISRRHAVKNLGHEPREQQGSGYASS